MPDFTKVPLKTVMKFDWSKIKPIKEYLAVHKLQKYQQEFLADETDPQKAYYYLRVIFRRE